MSMNSHAYILEECTSNLTLQAFSVARAKEMSYHFFNGLKSLLTHGTHHPDSVDFLRLMTFSLGRTLAYLKQFSMGDGARNTRPEREITPLDCVTSFEPLPAPIGLSNNGISIHTL